MCIYEHTYILSSSPTFTLTSAHHKLMHKHSLSHHNAFSFFTMHIQCQHLPQNGIFFPFFFLFFFQPHIFSTSIWNNLLSSVWHAQTLSSFKSHSRLAFALLLLTLPTVFSLPRVNLCVCVCVCVCVCACVCVHVCHIYMGLGGWDEVWWQICVYCVLMLVVLA